MDGPVIEKIREALKDWQRPCETEAGCQYCKNGACSQWSCKPEDEIINSAKTQFAKTPA
ncbi:hypothetical protein AGMMS49944_03630 [Spirochaetia bacterium]|nr:hypothetical protein AGMMS49944_03630 [Spirochaetia bacterium]